MVEKFKKTVNNVIEKLKSITVLKREKSPRSSIK